METGDAGPLQLAEDGVTVFGQTPRFGNEGNEKAGGKAAVE